MSSIITIDEIAEWCKNPFFLANWKLLLRLIAEKRKPKTAFLCDCSANSGVNYSQLMVDYAASQ